MEIMFMKTKRRLYFKRGAEVYFTSNDYEDMNFRKTEAPNSLKKWVKIGGDDIVSLRDAKAYINRSKKAERLHRKKEAERLNIEMKAVLKDTKKYSALEIWQAVRWALKNNCAWRGADALLQDNALSRKIVSELGYGYTVTPFDDGTVLVKTKSGKRFGNSRKWNSLTEIIER
jgi:hypothetical protein